MLRKWVKLLKYSSSDVVGIILSIDENHAEEPTVWTCSNQEERCCGKKTLAYIDFQSVTDAWQWQYQPEVKSCWQYTSLILVDPGDKVVEACYRNVMLLQQFLPAIYVRSRASFYSAPQCSHCKRYTSYSNSVRLSVCQFVTRRHCVKMTAGSTVQFALSDSKMYLVL